MMIAMEWWFLTGFTLVDAGLFVLVYRFGRWLEDRPAR